MSARGRLDVDLGELAGEPDDPYRLGYPVLATVVLTDLPASMGPAAGATVRFEQGK